MNKTKIIVVGGGPAGSATAYFLAKRGIEVTLLDKDKWPRDKVCGGGLSANTFPILKEMNLMKVLDKKANFKFKRYVIYRPNGQKIEAPIKQRNEKGAERVPYSYVVKREIFDELLLKKAREAGVNVLTETEVVEVTQNEKVQVITRGKDKYECDLVVIASGSGGLVNRLQNNNSRKGLAIGIRAYYSKVSGLSEQIECFLDEDVGWGYGWIFPLSKDEANVGYGINVEYLKGRGKNIRELFADVCKRPLIRMRLKEAKQEGKAETFPLRMGYDESMFRSGKTLFVGDAANLIFPISGEGIAYALRSGQIAAEVIFSAYEDDILDFSKLVRYEKKCAKSFSDFKYALKLQKVMAQPKLLRFIFKNALYDKKMGEQIISVLEHSSDIRTFYNIRTLFKNFSVAVKRQF